MLHGIAKTALFHKIVINMVVMLKKNFIGLFVPYNLD